MERERDSELLCIYASITEAVRVMRAHTSTTHTTPVLAQQQQQQQQADLEVSARAQIVSYLGRLTHHSAHRVSVMEILYGLLFAESKDSSNMHAHNTGGDRYLTSAAFVKWLLSLLQALIDAEFELDYVRQSLRMKSDAKDRLLRTSDVSAISAIEARVNRLNMMLMECALRTRIAETALATEKVQKLL